MLEYRVLWSTCITVYIHTHAEWGILLSVCLGRSNAIQLISSVLASLVKEKPCQVNAAAIRSKNFLCAGRPISACLIYYY